MTGVPSVQGHGSQRVRGENYLGEEVVTNEIPRLEGLGCFAANRPQSKPAKRWLEDYIS